MVMMIIAEIGVNHGGSISKASHMMDIAKEIGADAVKFQLYSADRVCKRDSVQYQDLARCELSAAQVAMLRQDARDIGIKFGCTPDHLPDAEALKDMQPDFIKIGSAQAKDVRFVNKVAHMGMPMIISTGMMTEHDIGKTYDAANVGRRITFLHCVSAYPCPLSELNLGFIHRMRALFPRCGVGYSSHYAANDVAGVACAAMGVDCYEFHLALEGDTKAIDYASSMEPNDAAEMISKMRDVQIALGDGVKRIMPSEAATRAILDARR